MGKRDTLRLCPTCERRIAWRHSSDAKNGWRCLNVDGSEHRCRDYMMWVKIIPSYEEKDEAKARGAVWDAAGRYWWMKWRPGICEEFRRWNPRAYYGDKRVEVDAVLEVAD